MSPLPSQRSNARRAAPESGAHPPGEGILLSGSAVTPYLIPCAGPEIGVASTKAFTTQLAALSMLVIALARHHGADAERERGLVTHLVELPGIIEKTLALDRSSIAWPSASPTSVILFS